MMRRKILYGTALVALLAIAAGAYFAKFHPRPAPVVSFPTADGQIIAPQALRGNVVLVNFWSVSCGYCLREMPKLVRTHERFANRGFETIAVAMRKDPPSEVLRYVAAEKLPFTVAFDPVGDLAKAYGNVYATPTTFVIDRRGRIVKRIIGEADFAALDALIERKLDEPA